MLPTKQVPVRFIFDHNKLLMIFKVALIFPGGIRMYILISVGIIIPVGMR